MNEEKEIGPGEAQRVLHDRGWRWRIWRHRVVGADGVTVAEALLPRLKDLPGTSMRKMLGAGG